MNSGQILQIIIIIALVFAIFNLDKVKECAEQYISTNSQLSALKDRFFNKTSDSPKPSNSSPRKRSPTKSRKPVEAEKSNVDELENFLNSQLEQKFVKE